MVHKALILEDNKVDASLMEQYLYRSALEFKVECVTSGQGYEKAVKIFKPDIIISDYRLKQYSGLDAIQYRNLHCGDVPILIVSGTIGEEKAVELIKEGATDFLIKDNAAARLGQSIVRAIKEANEKTKRKRIEEKFKSSEERFRMLFEHSMDGIIIGDPGKGEVITANAATCSMLQYKSDEMSRKPLAELIDLTKKRVNRGIEKRNRQGYFQGEIYIKRKDNTFLPVEISSRILKLKNGEQRSYYIIRDISDRVEARKKLRASLEEKETLLTEVHHRVKNNLAVVSGIMEMQAIESENEELKNKLFDSQSRIKSIALTHELLYQEKTFSSISYSSNVKKLIGSISKTMNNGVSFDFDMDKVKLNINQALPCSLILNELVTNSLKHAFKGKRGKVKIALKEKGETIHLIIKDDGVGLPDSFTLDEANTMGFTLVKILSRQLNGHLNVTRNNGTQFHLQFSKTDFKGSGSSIIDK